MENSIFYGAENSKRIADMLWNHRCEQATTSEDTINAMWWWFVLIRRLDQAPAAGAWRRGRRRCARRCARRPAQTGGKDLTAVPYGRAHSSSRNSPSK